MTITISDILTSDQIKEATVLYRKLKGTGAFAETICREMIKPRLAEINRKLGQENDPTYLSYAVEYVLSQGSK